MPVHLGIDEITNKQFYQWGDHGKKYFFNPNNKEEKYDAYRKAYAQGIAILYSEHKIK